MTAVSSGQHAGQEADRLLLLHSEHQLVPGAIRAAVSGHHWMVHEHKGSIESLPASCRRLHPAVTVVVVFGGGEALAACRSLARASNAGDLVFMSRREDAEPHEVYQVMAEGAAGWLTLDMDPVRIPYALDGVLRGEPALPRHLVSSLLTQIRRERPETSGEGLAGAALTRRETQAAWMLATGIPTSDVAEVMQVSTTTVRGYLASVRRKLGVRTRAEIAASLRGRGPAQPHT